MIRQRGSSWKVGSQSSGHRTKCPEIETIRGVEKYETEGKGQGEHIPAIQIVFTNALAGEGRREKKKKWNNGS